MPLAEKHGLPIKKNMRVGRARTLCEEVALFPRDRALESAVWERVERPLNAATPYVERAWLGRSFVRLHDREALKHIVKRMGQQAGFAPRRFDTHLASRKAAEGKTLEISTEYTEAFRRGLPIERLVPVGVDQEIVERLKLFGYETVAVVATLSKRHLKAQFGEEEAHLYDRLQASERPSVSVNTPPPTIEVTHQKEGWHEQALDVSELSNGVYFLRPRSEGEVRTQKLTVVQ